MAKKKTLYKADFSNSKQRAAEYAEAYRQKRSENKSFVEPLAKNKDYRTQQARQFAELSGANQTTDKNKTGREVVTPESWAGKQITVNNNLTTRRNTSNNRTPEPAPNAIHNFANSRQMANTFANRFRDQRSGKAETGITSLYDLARQTVEDQEKERKRKTGEILGRLGLKGTPVSEKGLLNAIEKNNSLYEENERKTRDFNRAGLRSLVTNRAEKQNEARRVAAEMYEENTPPLRRLVNAQAARSAQARNAAQQIMKESLQKDKTLGQYKTTATGNKPKMDWQSSFYTDTGFEDTLYDYINRNEEARSRQRLNDVKFGTTHDQYDNLDDETIREFNYIYEKSPENAYKYLDAKVGKNYTGQEAFITSLMNATGAPSISAAAAKGMAKLTGDREAERRNREWYGNLLRDTQAAAEQHPYASGAGSIAGTVALISAISSGAGAVSGTSGAFANLPGIARTMLNGAAVMGGATAIQQGGAAATGFLPTGEYARNVAISSAGGAAGAAVGSAVGAKVGQIAGNVLRGSKLAENQLARTLTAALVAGMSASGYSLGNTGVSETASYLRDPKNYKPDMKRITKDALTAFAFGMFSYASRAGRTEGQAAPQEEFRSEFFDDCSSPQEARAKLRQYSKQYHPDLPTGDADMMARINADYAGWMNNWNATRGMEAYTRAQQAAETGNSQEYAAAKREFDECVNALVLQTQSANATAEAVEAAQILQVMSEEMSMPAGNGSVMLPAMADDVPQQDARTQIADLTRADNTSMEESLEQVRQMTEEAQGNAETAISTIEEQDAYPEIPQEEQQATIQNIAESPDAPPVENTDEQLRRLAENSNEAEMTGQPAEETLQTPEKQWQQDLQTAQEKQSLEAQEELALRVLAEENDAERERQRQMLFEAGKRQEKNIRQLYDSATMLSDEEKLDALEAGNRASLEQVRTEVREENLNARRQERSDLLGEGSGRTVSQSEGIGDGSIPSASGVSEKTSRRLGENAADRESNGLRYTEEIEAKEILRTAREGEKVHLIESGTTPALSRTMAMSKASGVKVITYASEKAISVETGEEVRASYDPENDEVTVRANDESARSDQLFKHELVERALQKGRIKLEECTDHLSRELSEAGLDGDEAVNTLGKIYATLSGTDLNSPSLSEAEREEIISEATKEMVCDSTGINQFAGLEGYESVADLMDYVISVMEPYLNERMDRVFDAAETEASTEIANEGTDINTKGERTPDSTAADLKKMGIVISDDGNVAHMMYSSKFSWKTEEEINKAVAALVKNLGVSEADAKAFVQSELSLTNLILNPQNVAAMDFEPDERYEAIKKNSDYPQGTVDFNNDCRKRNPFTQLFNRLQKRNPNRVFTAEDLEIIRQNLIKHNVIVACALCYVEERRQKLGEIAEGFINLYKNNAILDRFAGKREYDKFAEALEKVGDDKYIPTIYDLITYDGMRALQAEHPAIAETFKIFNNARGMAAGRLIEGRAGYRRELLTYSQKKVKAINDAGGLRIFSYSDFEAVNLLDIVQIVQDAAIMGIKIQAYTKVPSFARVVRNTGIKLNRSLIAAGTGVKYDSEGRLVLDLDPVEGIDINDPDFFDSTDDRDIGNILVGMADEQIKLAMASDFVDYIIPFHTNLPKTILEAKGIAHWKNYKDSQTDKDKKTGKVAAKQVNIYTDVIQAARAEGNPIKNKKEFVEKFLQVCKERNLTPRFAQFLNVDSNGEYVYTEGYHKFLIDFKLFDKNGNIVEQQVVRPVFDDAYNTKLMKDYAAGVGYTNITDAVYRDTVDELNKKTKGSGVRYSSKLKLNQNDKKYLKALESGDLETAKEMVSEAAKKAGYTENLYHGTAAFGFTKFDISKMDDKASIFATSDPKVAESYSGETKRTKIYQRQGRSDDEIIDRIDSMGDEDLLPLIKEHIDKKYEQVPAEKLQEMRAERVTDIRYYADRVMDYVDKETDEAKRTAASRLASSMYKIARAKNADDVDDYKTDYNNDAWEMKWLDEDAFYDMFDGGKGVTTTGLAIQEFGRLMESDTMFTNGEKVAGSTLEIFTPGEARTELIGTLSKGIYHLYGKKENMLEFDAGGDNWNFINTTKIPNMKFRIKGASGVQTEGAMYTFDEAQKLAAESTRRKNGQDDSIVPEDVRDELGILRGWKFSSKKTGKPILELESLLSKRVNTRTISEYARNAGYDGVIMRNLKDSGGVTPYNQPSDVYIYFKSDAVKSADEVTYNDNGEVIPLSERFDQKKADIRYSSKLPLAGHASNAKNTPIDREYLEAVQLGDDKKKKRMVKEAAEKAGYTAELYHGSKAFGFTEFNLDELDDKSSIFATSNAKVAETYSGKTQRRKISEATNVSDMTTEEVETELKKVAPSYVRVPESEIKNQKKEKQEAVRKIADDIYDYTRSGDQDFETAPGAAKAISEAIVGDLWRIAKAKNLEELEIGQKCLRQDHRILRDRYPEIAAKVLDSGRYFEIAYKNSRHLEKILSEGGNFIKRENLSYNPDYVDNWITEEQAKKTIINKGGIYHLYGKEDNLLIVDAEGALWDEIPAESVIQGMTKKEKKYLVASSDYFMQDYVTLDEARKAAELELSFLGDEDDSVEEVEVEGDGWHGDGIMFVSHKTKEILYQIEEDLDAADESFLRTREVAEYAKNQGFSGVKIMNLVDDGPNGRTKETSDVYIYFAPSQLKSADDVVYGDDGEIIPLSERFKEDRKDLRYSSKLPLMDYEGRKYVRELTEKYEAQIKELKDRAYRRQAAQRLLRRARALQQLARRRGSLDFKAQVDKLIGDLDTVSVGMRENTREALTALREEVMAQCALDPDYKAAFGDKYDKLFVRLTQKHISEMTLSEIIELTEQIVALEHSKRTYDREILDNDARKFAEEGRRGVEQQKNIKGLNFKTEIGALIGKYKLYMLNPVRAMAMLDGYQKDGVFTRYGKMLNDGQTKAAEFRMRAEKLFEELHNNDKLVKDFSKQDIEIDTMEGKKKISKGMRIALYMHLQNPDNIKHIAYGGITIPNEKQYRKGKYTNAYNTGETIHFAPWNNGKGAVETMKAIREITKQMTPEEIEYAKTCNVFFNQMCKDAINETSMKLQGRELAIVDNYFPIRVNPNFLQQEMSGLTQNGTIEGMGMLKERTGALNPVLLEDVSQVVMRQTQNTSMYYGMAIPIRNFNRFYNYVATEFKTSMQQAVSDTWHEAGKNYLKNLVADLQFGRQTQRNWLDSLKGLYAGTALNVNLGVAIKQSASYPFAASVIGWKPLLKAMGATLKRADYAYMDSITPWSYMRRQGLSGTEMGEVAKQKTKLDNNKALQKVKSALNWIQIVDVKTTNVLFTASEYYVQDHYPDLEKRGPEYSEKVAEVYNEMLQRTQPSYDVMQRNEFLRDKGDMMKVFGMFKTQTFNMGGEIIDAYEKWKAHAEYAKKDKSYQKLAAESRKAFFNTAVATAASQMMLAVLSAVAAAVMHRMKPYRDDKGEVTAESVVGKVLSDFVGSFAGMAMFGNEVWEYGKALATGEKIYDIEYPALEIVNGIRTSTTEAATAVKKALNSKKGDDIDAARKKMMTAALELAKLKGIPAQNIYNVMNAVYLWGQEITDDEGKLFDAGEGLLGYTDTSVSKDQYAERAAEAYASGDTEAGDKWSEKTTEKKLQKAMYGDQGIDEDSSKAMVEYVKAGGDAADFEKGKSLGKELEEKDIKGDEVYAFVVDSKDYSNQEKIAWFKSSTTRAESKKYTAWKNAGYGDWDFLKYRSDLSKFSGDGKQEKIVNYIKTQTTDTKKRKALWLLAGYKESSFDKNMK